MLDLGWDIAETQLQERNKAEKTQELPETVTLLTAVPLKTTIAKAILLIILLRILNSYIKEIPKITRKVAQTVESMATRINDTQVIRNFKITYGEAEKRIIIATRVINHTSHDNHHN